MTHDPDAVVSLTRKEFDALPEFSTYFPTVELFRDKKWKRQTPEGWRLYEYHAIEGKPSWIGFRSWVIEVGVKDLMDKIGKMELGAGGQNPVVCSVCNWAGDILECQDTIKDGLGLAECPKGCGRSIFNARLP